MIGVFDSGFGGLTVLKSLLKDLPEYDYLYLGDNLRAPYGNRPEKIIVNFLEQAVEYFFSQGCKLIIIACNTATEYAISSLQEKYLRQPNVKDKKILGVILPQVEAAVQLSKTKTIGVVGTKATISSNCFERELKKLDQSVRVIQKACPLLVPLIEENWHDKPEATMILKKYLRNLKTQNPDLLILGCTHYPFMEKKFKRIMGKKIQILSPGKIVSSSLKDYLNRHPEIEQNLTKNSTLKLVSTDKTEKFEPMAKKYLNLTNLITEQIFLE